MVRNEFEIGENNPDRILSQRLLSAAFEWHNYGKSTIGNRTDIETGSRGEPEGLLPKALPALQYDCDRFGSLQGG